MQGNFWHLFLIQLFMLFHQVPLALLSMVAYLIADWGNWLSDREHLEPMRQHAAALLFFFFVVVMINPYMKLLSHLTSPNICMIAFSTIFLLVKILQQPIRIFEISGFCCCHGEQNAGYHIKEHKICIRAWCQKWPCIFWGAVYRKNKQWDTYVTYGIVFFSSASITTSTVEGEEETISKSSFNLLHTTRVAVFGVAPPTIGCQRFRLISLRVSN